MAATTTTATTTTAMTSPTKPASDAGTMTIITRVPIPSSVPPASVLASLQTYEDLITPNPYLDRFEPRTLSDAEAADPFFFPEGWNMKGYTVYDCVPILPGLGWTKSFAMPCVFQSFARGVKCCAHAQVGVTVRSSYEVRRRGEVEGGGGDAPDRGPGDGDYELVDISQVTCSVFVRPFVRAKLAAAHHALLEKLVSKVGAGAAA
ncbi:hypothetical protein VTJ83DRAFT_5122 [Remersonia thermophila]|uniref:DUF7053 domain-containing protein n=1 Tax=Remersonia thermophila TaxID=72144 RepID=A0ABR4DBY4_9PEZI